VRPRAAGQPLQGSSDEWLAEISTTLPPGRTVPRASRRFSTREVKTPRGSAPRLAHRPRGVYAEPTEKGVAMSWTKPTFEEIKMDAEAKSYFDGIGG